MSRVLVIFFFKQKTAYEMRISDWSSECALPISAVTCGVATGADTGTLPVSRRTARADMAFMLCRNGGGCQRFNPESQVFAHAGGRPRVKERPPAPPRDRRPPFRKPKGL